MTYCDVYGNDPATMCGSLESPTASNRGRLDTKELDKYPLDIIENVGGDCPTACPQVQKLFKNRWYYDNWSNKCAPWVNQLNTDTMKYSWNKCANNTGTTPKCQAGLPVNYMPQYPLGNKMDPVKALGSLYSTKDACERYNKYNYNYFDENSSTVWGWILFGLFLILFIILIVVFVISITNGKSKSKRKSVPQYRY